jgi:hypothetical protein
MVKVSIRVQSGATRFDVAVVTVSAEQAVRLVRGRYLTSDVRVKAPTGPLWSRVFQPPKVYCDVRSFARCPSYRPRGYLR